MSMLVICAISREFSREGIQFFICCVHRFLADTDDYFNLIYVFLFKAISPWLMLHVTFNEFVLQEKKWEPNGALNIDEGGYFNAVNREKRKSCCHSNACKEISAWLMLHSNCGMAIPVICTISPKFSSKGIQVFMSYVRRSIYDTDD